MLFIFGGMSKTGPTDTRRVAVTAAGVPMAPHSCFYLPVEAKYCKNMAKVWDKPGTTRDNHGTTMGQPWDNYGTTYGTTQFLGENVKNHHPAMI